VDFFTSNIRNRNTRLAYSQAVSSFAAFCKDRGLTDNPLGEGAARVGLRGRCSRWKKREPRWIPSPPAQPWACATVPDRLMVYTFARVGAPIHLKVEDVFIQGRRHWVRLQEKGGREDSLPCDPESSLAAIRKLGLFGDPVETQPLPR
jgi:integrase